MKTVRLLPVVIFSALALLFFKGVGLVTSGGYLIGSEVLAAGGAESADSAPVAESAEPTITIEPDPTLEDDAPTLEDGAPTMGPEEDAKEGGEAEGESTASDHATSEEGAAAEATEPPEEGPAETEQSAEAPSPEAASVGTAPSEGEQGSETVPEVPPIDAVAEDPRAEAVPMMQNEEGQLVPLVADDGGSLTENIILERLSARRAELDAREQELALRLELVEAAEARLDERAAALAEVEARINALVDQQKAAEDGQFASIINMYEQMKPGEAAAIFNELDMQVLVKVAGGMNPRKMAPILAKMNATRAQQLTLALAAIDPEPAAVAPAAAPGAPQDLSALPQIVGQ